MKVECQSIDFVPGPYQTIRGTPIQPALALGIGGAIEIVDDWFE